MSIPAGPVCESRSMTTERVDQVPVDPVVARSLAGAAPRSFWLDQPDAPEPLPPLAGDVTADLAVIGGGFTGLWTALLARERYPDLDVVLVEAQTVGWAASGRNGGFCSASLTHGIGNGLERFPDEMPLLERLGAQNLGEIGETVTRYGIDCDFQRDRRAGARRRGLAARRPGRRGGRRAAARPRRRGARRGRRPRRARLAACGQAGSSTRQATRWSSRAASPGGCAAPACDGGADLRAHAGDVADRRRRGRRRCGCGRRTARSARPGPPSPRACPAGRCCAGSARTWSRSGTTCS